MEESGNLDTRLGTSEQESSVPAKPVPVPDFSSTQLPEMDLPFSGQIEALMSLAEAGHPAAACRLGLGVKRCRVATRRLQSARQMQDQLMRGVGMRLNEDLMVASIANTLERAEASIIYCEGVQPDSLPDTDSIIEKALPNMDTWQKVLMVMSREDGGLSRFPQHFSAPDGLGWSTEDIYPQFLTEHAYPILRQGIAEANPLALEGMMMVHAPAWVPGGQISPRHALPDRREFVRYALLMEQAYGSEALGQVAGALLTRIFADMSEVEIQRARKQAEREARLWMNVASANQEKSRSDRKGLDEIPERMCER